MTADKDLHSPLPEIMGGRVTEDENGNICLNDLWSLAGKPENRRARDWYRSKRAAALEAALIDRIVEILHKPRKDAEQSTPYRFTTPFQLLTDFWSDVEQILKEEELS